MTTDQRAARTIALLLLVQMIGGPVVNFLLMGRVVAAPGFLQNAATHSFEIGLAALLGPAMGMLSVGIAIAAWPVLRRHGRATGLWLLALAIASLALVAVEASTVLSMRSLSEAYAAAGAVDDGGQFQALATVVGAARTWAHYMNLIVVGAMTAVLYGALLRFALVPRALAAFGLAAALLMLVAVAMPVFGQRIVFPLLAPLGLAHLALVPWLLARGFAERSLPAPAPHD